jgi:ribosomal protein L37E
VDLLSIQRPFSFPLPGWVRDTRIKEWESFLIQDDRFCLDAILGNMKLYRMAQVFLYDKETGERLRFRKIIPLSGWRMPRNLYNASIDSRSYGFFFRIHNWLDANTIKIDLDIEATCWRPSFTAHAEYKLEENTVPLVTSLLFSDKRSMYAYKVLSPVRGDIVFGGRHISLNPARTSGVFCDFKGYYPYRMRSVWCTACGFDRENRRYGFSIAENQTKETYKNNENALWVDGRLTPLPPVRITMPGGVDGEWIIQDIEGMVDLVFTPRERIHSNMNLFVTNTEYVTPLGFFNGMLAAGDGVQIQVHNLWGLGEKVYLRV